MGMEGYSGGMTPAEAVLLTDHNRCTDGMFGGNSWVFFLFFLLAMGSGWGYGFGGRGNMATAEGQYATQADIQRGFDHNTVVNKLDGITQGICQLGYNDAQMQNQTQAQISQLGYQMQNCCCETNRNIDAVRAENYKNTCEITTAIHAEGEATRALINANTMQSLRDQLQAAQLQLGQLSQTQTLIDQLRPCARPAYITCSPYQAMNYGYGYGCGNGCCN